MQTGVAGDMILGALFDLGLDFPEWKKGIDSLGLTGIAPDHKRVSRNGIMATHFRVGEPEAHSHRGLSEIIAIIGRSGVPEKAKADAIAVFTRLARVEARIHGLPVEQVHFHEVGAVDAIVDIVGACLGFEMLGVSGFFTTPFTFGSGTVETRHGTLAVPVPATLALSEGFPSRRTGLSGELCTPTGTAIVSTLARPLPPDWIGTMRKSGYGAGSRELPGIANVLRICLMEGSRVEPPAYAVYQLECNLDNMTPELIGYAAERLLSAGCKDVWQEPIFMKKNRSAVKLCALVERPQLEPALSLIASETATGGMRWFPVERLVAEKSFQTVETRFGTVDLKTVFFPGRSEARYAPEFESCRRLAQASAAPLQEVYREAISAAQEQSRRENRTGKEEK